MTDTEDPLWYILLLQEFDKLKEHYRQIDEILEKNEQAHKNSVTSL